MRYRRRVWMPVLAVLALLAAACAAEEAATELDVGAVQEPVAEQVEPEAAPTTAEPEPVDTAPEAEPEAEASPEPEPEAESEPAPTTSADDEAESEPAPTTSTTLEPEPETEASPEPEPEVDTTPEPEPAPEPEAAPEPEPEAAPEPEPEAAPEPEPEAAPEPEPEADTSPEPEPEPEPEPTPQPSSGVAAVLALLDALTVAAEQPSGYDRDLFKHWTDEDGDGCDTRREVLLAEAVVAPTQGSRCSLSDGEWISRYDGLTDQGNGSGFDVDHLVPLAEAWDSGARGWTADRREQYANDLGYEHSLIAVSARSNRSKGARDPATWLPPEADQHCWYSAAWVHVKTRWSLTVDTAETDTLAGILSGCSDSAIDVGLPAPVVEEQDTTTEEQADSATEEPTTTQPPEPDCHPAYTPCLPNLPGDALNCGDLTSDQKPITVNEIGVDPYRLDRDGDGRGCTS